MWWSSAALLVALATAALVGLAWRDLGNSRERLARSETGVLREACWRSESAAVRTWRGPLTQSAQVGAQVGASVVSSAMGTGAKLTRSGGRIARKIYRRVADSPVPEPLAEIEETLNLTEPELRARLSALFTDGDLEAVEDLEALTELLPALGADAALSEAVTEVLPRVDPTGGADPDDVTEVFTDGLDLRSGPDEQPGAG